MNPDQAQPWLPYADSADRYEEEFEASAELMEASDVQEIEAVAEFERKTARYTAPVAEVPKNVILECCLCHKELVLPPRAVFGSQKGRAHTACIQEHVAYLRDPKNWLGAPTEWDCKQRGMC